MWIRFDDLETGQTILDSRDAAGRGILVTTTDKQTIRLRMSDGTTMEGWDTDAGTVQAGALQHLVFIVDGAPNIITVLVDGKLCDGGKDRQYGWGRFGESVGSVNSAGAWTLAPSLHGELKKLRIYRRYLTTSEAVGNFHAGCNK
jgi:hypothetical protein